MTLSLTGLFGRSLDLLKQEATGWSERTPQPQDLLKQEAT
jgi:hypothetical protein